MKLQRPFPKSTLSQAFSLNDVPLYVEKGLTGHTGQDYVVAWGTPVPCAVDNSYCYSTINKDNPDPSKYRTPCFIVEDETGVYEIIYGHASDILAIPDRMYHAGEIVSKVGNTGAVYVGGRETTTAAKLKGSKDGSHLHFQVRLLTKVVKTRKGYNYVVDGNGILKKDGYYYEVVNYDNGRNGCIDPEPFFEEKKPYIFTRDLYLGVSGPDVLALQKYLNSHGFTISTQGAGSPGKETAYFGRLTKNALARYQIAKGIWPASGHFGSITRSYFNS